MSNNCSNEIIAVARTTKIAGRDVPIEPGELVTVEFTPGRGGIQEAGQWEFWTVFNGGAYTARCRQGCDPGERFRRMEGLQAYGKAWKVAAPAKGIRPAKPNEVIVWLNGHREDADFAVSCKIGNKTLTVEKEVITFRFVSVHRSRS